MAESAAMKSASEYASWDEWIADGKRVVEADQLAAEAEYEAAVAAWENVNEEN